MASVYRGVVSFVRTIATDRYAESVAVLLAVGSVGLGLTFAFAPERFGPSGGFGMLFYGDQHPGGWGGIAPQAFGMVMALTGTLLGVLAIAKSAHAAWPALGLTLAYLAIPVAFLSSGGTPSAVWVYCLVGLVVALTGLRYGFAPTYDGAHE